MVLIATVIVWFLQSFSLGLTPVQNSQDSIMAAISGVLVPVMRPAGLGDWKIVTSLISGFMAKESVVSVLRVLYGGAEGATAAMNAITAAGLLIFCLLYTPCVAAVASIRREMGRIWAVGVVLWQCAIAWAAAFVFHLIATLIMGGAL